MSKWHAANVASTFGKLLHNLVNNYDDLVSDMDSLSKRDKMQVSEWNSDHPEKLEACIHDLFKQQAIARPDALAIYAWDGNLTYRMLDTLSTRLALHLMDLGVRSEVMVPLCFEKSSWMVVAMMGVLKAGGACVCLDPSHPKARLSGIVADTNAMLIVTVPKLVGLFEGMADIVVALGQSWLDAIPATAHASLSSVQPNDLAYVIFTSGSTGVPKGILMDHATICTSSAAHGSVTNVGPESRVLQFAAYTFDIAILDICTTLMRGGCLCVPSEHDRVNRLSAVINEMQVNWADLTPSVANILAPSAVPSLKTMVLAGEAVTKRTTDLWSEAVNLNNCYGPAECSICAWKGLVGRTGTPANIGRGLSSIFWVVEQSSHDRLAPVGCIGELVIEGPLLSRGYLNDPKKTKAAFIENPLWVDATGSRTERRMYKTGDLVRYNPDGTMDYFGRKDTQVKVRGQRVELGEIEHHLMRTLPDVAHVAVEQVVPPGRKDGILAAFICFQDHDQGDAEAESISMEVSEAQKAMLIGLSRRLNEILTSYMIPSMYIPLLWMPLTVSGKIDRKMLRKLAAELSAEQVAHYLLAEGHKRAPTTDMEKEIHKFWVEVLGLDAEIVGLDDNFFQLGGDSIGAMRLANVARDSGITLTVASIFRMPKLSDMSGVAVNSDGQSQLELKPFILLEDTEPVENFLKILDCEHGITREVVEDAFPCSPLQRGLMSLSVRQPGTYIFQAVFRLQPSVDTDRFRKACEAAFQRNSILRTRIVNTEASGSLQVVLKDRVNWRTAASLEAYLEEDKQTLMDYGDALTRYGIVNGNKGCHFVWTVHHAIYDGWTLPLILNDMERLYHQQNLSEPTPPAYAGFIAHILRTDLSTAEEFWRSQLLEVTLSSYPQPRSASFQPLADSVLPHQLLISRPTGSGITMSTLIRAAWAMVISEYSGSEDVVFGVMLSGRNAPVQGIAQMTGPTITTIPVRVSLIRTQTVTNFLVDVQNQSADSIPFEHIGLQNIRRLGTEAERVCDFQNLLLIHPAHPSKSSSEFWIQEQVAEAGMQEHLAYPLVLDFWLGNGKLDITASFDERLISTPQMQRIMYQFEHAIRQLNDQATERTVQQVELFSPQDRRDVLAENCVLPEVVSACIHDLVSLQAAEHPDKLAVCSWDDKFTYRELDELSTRVAHHLVSLGVGPEAFVPLCFDKSAWTIVAMLGVLKAGGAYVSLNPTHPMNRNKHIIHDISATVLLVGPSHREFHGLVPHTIVIDREMVEALPNIAGAPCNISTSNPAFVVFTSGSTGIPKGIVMEHGAFCTSSKAHATSLHIGSESRVMQFAAYTYDVSMAEIFTTLMHGGCVCVPSEEDRLNNLAGTINEMNVNWMFLTPTVAGLLQPASVPKLKTLVLGGEHATTDNVTTWASHVNLINSYGPAECAIWTSCAPGLDVDADPANLGHRVGALLWVTDANDHDKLTPVGCIGELLIEGPVLARGYLNDAAKTTAAFITNPKWLPDDGVGQHRRMYKTGDLVRYDSNGTLSIVGRKDSQVKLHGQRLELGEIEHHLSTGENVKNAMAILPSSGLCRQRLVAVLSFHDLSSRTTDEGTDLRLVCDGKKEEASSLVLRARRHLSSHLPTYMVPTLWIVVEAIPLNTSGKMDRKATSLWVKEMDEEMFSEVLDGGEEKVSKRPPTTDMEKILQLLWANALGISTDVIGVDHSFLRLGGDSISAMRLTAAARAEGITLSIATIFRLPILCEMSGVAVFMRESEKTTKRHAPFSSLGHVGIEKLLQNVIVPQISGGLEEIEDVLEATDYQSWVLGSGHLKPRGYNNYFIFRLDSPLDIARLEQSCATLVAHHPILRTVFIVHKRQLLQVVMKTYYPEFKHYERLDNVPDVPLALIQEDMKRDVELGEGILRFMLVKQGVSKHHLVMRMSHAQYDGICLPIIVGDLKAAYTGQELSIASKYSDFVYSTLETKSSEPEMFWSKLLTGSHMTNILSHSKPSYWNVVNKSLIRVISAPSLSAHGITFATTIKAAWALVLGRLSGESDIVFGQISTGRTALVSGIQRIVGPCLNILPVRVTLPSSSVVSDLLHEVQDQHLESLQYESFGFRKIIDECTQWPKWTRFSSILQHTNLGNTVNEVDVVASDTNFHLDTIGPPHDVSDLWIWSHPSGGDNFTIQLDFSDGVIPDAFAAELLEMLCSIIGMISKNVSVKIPLPTPSSQPTFAIPISLAHGIPAYVPQFNASRRTSTHPELIVKRAWDTVLGSVGSADVAYTLDTPFFEVWGDLIAAVHFASFYRKEERLEVSPEDIIEYPTMRRQMLLFGWDDNRSGSSEVRL